MKIIFLSIILLFFILSCGNLTKTQNSSNQLDIRTDKTYYSISDSIKIILENSTEIEILLRFRCKTYLEISYQKKNLDSWSDNLDFWYMSLGCLTSIDTLKPNSIFNYSMKSGIFDSTGMYRLMLNYYDPVEKTNGIKYSNAFEIR
jgi:hypothetical protein